MFWDVDEYEKKVSDKDVYNGLGNGKKEWIDVE